MHSRVEPEPFVAVLDFCNGSLTLWRPDAPQDRLETEASFIFAPRLYLLRRMLFLESFDSQF